MATTTSRLHARDLHLRQPAFRRALITGAAIVLASACSSEPAAQLAPTEGGFSFVVIGDTPYSTADEEMLAAALPLIRDTNPPFIVHVGDYKGGRTPCTTDHDDRFAALIDALKPTPVFYTPGDNEWTDCDRNINPETARNWSDLARLQVIRERFFATPPATPAEFEYRSQQAQIENATWRYQGVRFATIHVVGTSNGRNWVTGDPLAAAKAAVEARDAANSAWLGAIFTMAQDEAANAVVIAMQADLTDVGDAPPDLMCDDVADHNAPCDGFVTLRAQIRDLARAFQRPVLLIHGDTAPFTLNQEFSGEEAATLWRLNAAGDTGDPLMGGFYGTRDVTLVTIDAAQPAPFAARGLVTGKAPKD